MKTGWLCIIALLCAARSAYGQARIWNDDERIVITTFNDLSALAFDGTRVFAAGQYGLEIYDARARRWLAPSTIEDGYPVHTRPNAAWYDRTQGGLWLSTNAGVFFRSDLNGRWDMRPFTEADSIEMKAVLAARVVESDIAWRAMRAGGALDNHGRRWPITAAIPSDRPGVYWAATGGSNLILADARRIAYDWLPFGNITRGTSAIAVDAKGRVWYGGDGFGPRDGMARSDTALQSWVWFDAYPTRAPRSQVNRILTGDTVWVAAADGLFMLQPNARTWQRFGESDGLPSNDVGDIALTVNRLWIGTSKGLAVLDRSSGQISTAAIGSAINSLAVNGDTLWIASQAGLFSNADTTGVWRRATVAVVRFGNRLAALTRDGLYVREQSWAAAPLRNATLNAIGRIYDLQAQGDLLYVLGSRGIAEWNGTPNGWRFLTIPGDIIDAVADVARSGPFLWVATNSGAMRLRWP